MFLYIERKIKHAFTMIELVFVIVVIGIISAVMIPRMDRDVVGEATTQLASNIRYVQHLAMVDDKYISNAGMSNDANPNADTQFWYRKRWQIECTNNICTIYSDLNRDGTADENEIAADPLDANKRMTGDSSLITTASLSANKMMDYATKYNTTITSTCGNFLSFDHLGRPYAGDPHTFTSPTFSNTSDPTKGLLTANCVITLTDGDNNATITIRPETGYASVQIN